MAAAVLVCGIFACARLYITRNNFIAPVPVKLAIRNDVYGDGHFNAKRSAGRRHKGVDLLADIGTPVLSAKGGIVRHAGHKKGNGNYVVVSHLFGYRTYYCHLSEIAIKEGYFVKAGDVIGYVGKTGNANYRAMHSHLHFEIYKDAVPENPANYLELEDVK